MSKTGKNIWKIVKIVLIAALAAAVLFVGLVLFLLLRGLTQDRATNDLGEYGKNLDAVYQAADYMPSLDDCGTYTAAAVSFRQHESMFPHEGVTLLLRYDENGFEEQLRIIEDKYRFYDGENAYLQDIAASVNGYSFRVADLGFPANWCVHQCLLIGLNSDTNSIVYAYYYDSEVDYIEDLDQNIREYFYFPKEWEGTTKRTYLS